MKNYFIKFLIIVLFCTSGVAFAQVRILWSCNAMGMTPIPQALSHHGIVTTDLIEFRAGRVIFKENMIGTAGFICPIGSVPKRMQDEILDKISIMYRDEDGTGVNSNNITAELRRVNAYTGSVHTINKARIESNGESFDLIPTIDTEPWKSRYVPMLGDSIDHKFNFRHHYYVQVTMKKRANREALICRSSDSIKQLPILMQ